MAVQIDWEGDLPNITYHVRDNDNSTFSAVDPGSGSGDYALFDIYDNQTNFTLYNQLVSTPASVIINPTQTPTDNGIRQPDFPIPLPQWEEAIRTWGRAWPTHYYFFGTSFLIASFCMVISDIVGRSSRRYYPSTFSLNFFILVCGGCRGLALLLDPYGSSNILPMLLTISLMNIVPVCLTSTFTLLLWIFFRTAQIKLGPCGSPSFKFMNIFLFTYFITVISLDILAVFTRLQMLLLVLSEAIFIVYGSTLCVIFGIKSFKMLNFTGETQRAYKELSDYNLCKKDPVSGQRKKRVRRPDLSTRRLNRYDSLEDTTESSESDAKPASVIRKRRSSLEYHRAPDIEVTMADDLLTVLKLDRTRHRHSRFLDNTSISDYHSQTNGSNNSVSESGSVYTVEDFPQYTCDRGEHCDGTHHDNSPKTDRQTVQCSPNSPRQVEVHVDELPRDSIFELGYLGDNEFGTPNKQKANVDNTLNRTTRANSEPFWNGVLNQNAITGATANYVSYRRLLQGRHLHHLVKLSHVTTTALLLLCILHIYSMFGIYGVLSKYEKVQPWPWLIFQTCMRSCEFVMYASITYISISLSRQRRLKDRKRRKIQQNTSEMV